MSICKRRVLKQLGFYFHTKVAIFMSLLNLATQAVECMRRRRL